MEPLLPKMLAHDPSCSGMLPGVGDVRTPDIELGVEIIQVVETAAEEEILPNVAEGPLDLALGLGPIGLAGLGSAAVMGKKGYQRGIVGHHTGRMPP